MHFPVSMLRTKETLQSQLLADSTKFSYCGHVEQVEEPASLNQSSGQAVQVSLAPVLKLR